MSWSRLRQWGADHPDTVDVVTAGALLGLGILSVQVTQDVAAQMGAGSDPLSTVTASVDADDCPSPRGVNDCRVRAAPRRVVGALPLALEGLPV